MTESEWLSSNDIWRMVNFVIENYGFSQRTVGHPNVKIATNKQLKDFVCACCWLVSDELGRDAEQIVEWNSDRAKNPVSWAMGWAGNQTKPTPSQRCALLREIIGNPFEYIWINANRFITKDVTMLAEAAYHERTQIICSKCKGVGKFYLGTVVNLFDSLVNCSICDAKGYITDGKLDNQRLAVLSDALEEAGCTNQEILNHLRGECEHGMGACNAHPFTNVHFRGCWVLDMLRGVV